MSMNERHLAAMLRDPRSRLRPPPVRPVEATIVILDAQAAYVYDESDAPRAEAKADDAKVSASLRTYRASDLPRILDGLRLDGVDIYDMRKGTQRA